MGFFEGFRRKPKIEAAAAVVAGTISAVAPAAAAEMPQHVDVQKPTTIERVTSMAAPGLAKIQMEDGRTATLNVPSEPQAVSVTPEAFQARSLTPEAAPAPAVAASTPEYQVATPGAVIKSQLEEATTAAPLAAVTMKEAAPAPTVEAAPAETVTARPLNEGI